MSHCLQVPLNCSVWRHLTYRVLQTETLLNGGETKCWDHFKRNTENCPKEKKNVRTECFLELDWVFSELKNSTSFSNFSKPTPEKNPISKKLPNKKKRTGNWNTIKSNSELKKMLPKKMHFGQILVKILQTQNLTSFEPIFLNPKNSNSKHFGILKPEPQRGN